VHLITSDAAGEVVEDEDDAVNANVFRNLESPVSEGGENFSMGSVLHQPNKPYSCLVRSEKQLLCMARAILKRSKILIMDEVRFWFLYGCFIPEEYTAGNSKVMSII
jgi:hypothetical protein